MIFFVSMYPIWNTRTQKRLTNPETLIKANIHISGSVKTYKSSGQYMAQPSGGLKRYPK